MKLSTCMKILCEYYNVLCIFPKTNVYVLLSSGSTDTSLSIKEGCINHISYPFAADNVLISQQRETSNE
jgi:hypothetical protein